MNKIIVELERSGATPTEAIRRMLGDEEFYLTLLRQFIDKQEITSLEATLLSGLLSDAFVISHTMKGTAVTLGLSPLSEILSELTEYLRPFFTERKKVTPRDIATATASLEQIRKQIRFYADLHDGE